MPQFRHMLIALMLSGTAAAILAGINASTHRLTQQLKPIFHPVEYRQTWCPPPELRAPEPGLNLEPQEQAQP